MTDHESDAPDGAVEQRRQVRAGYDELAADYAEDREQDPDELALLDELVARIEGETPRILDAGCGNGRAAARPLTQRGAHVVGLDASRAQLDLAGETLADPAADGATAAPRPGLVQGDLTALPFETGTLDGIVALHSIIHVPSEEHATVLAEFGRVLAPGGWLLLTTGVESWSGENSDWLDSGAEMRWSFHGAEWTRETLSDLGFAVADERIIDDELGGGEWQYLLARRS